MRSAGKEAPRPGANAPRHGSDELLGARPAMASELTPVTAPEPVYRSPWQRWVGFWFPASDPTTLGFIRITTGLLVLYIHLAYSVDLQQFFGQTGWYSHRFIERERHEYPWLVSPFWSWDLQPVIPAKVPEFPHRRKAV